MIQLFFFLLLAQAPDFTLKNLEGADVTLDSLLQKGPVVLGFWNTACKCKCGPKLLDAFKKLSQEFENVTFVGINEDGPQTQKDVLPMAKSRKWNFLILYDENKELAKALQIKATMSHTFIIGMKREILYYRDMYKKGDEKQSAKNFNRLLKNELDDFSNDFEFSL